MLAALFFCFVFLLLLQAAMHKPLNHDEHMYVSSGALAARGQWPYANYPYFQMPLLSLVYGVAFLLPVDLLLAARLVNVILAFAACALLFFVVWRLLRDAAPFVRLGLAAGGILLYISGPQFVYAFGLAWNHDLPLLLTLAALALIMGKTAAQGRVAPLLLSGVLLGLATSSRLLFGVAVVPLLGVMLLEPASLRLRRVFSFCAGFALGLLPCLPFFITDPSAFFFGNATYHGLTEQYWGTLGYDRAMTLAGKLSYSLEVLMGEPGNWILLLGVLLVLFLVLRARVSAGNLAIVVLPLLTGIALFLGGLVPTPTWVQYFYAPYALLAVGFVLGIALIVRASLWRVCAPLFLLVVVVSIAFSVPRYLSLGNLLAVDDWTPGTVSRVSTEVRAAVSEGIVVTLSPIYPLQAGLDIYPGLASGPFGFRVAGILSPQARQEQGLISADDVVRLMDERPPEAILVGSEGALDKPLVGFAQAHSYREVVLSNGLSLWVRP